MRSCELPVGQQDLAKHRRRLRDKLPTMNASHVHLLLASDLHLEAGHYDLRGQIARLLDAGRRIDAVILAGDIVDSRRGDPVEYAAEQVPSEIPVAFVPGNHDFYGARFETLLEQWKAGAQGSNISVLTEATLAVRNPAGAEVVLVGTPLWSNLQSLGPVVEADLRRNLPRYIADFSHMVASNRSPWTVAHHLAQFERAERFLVRELSPAALEDGRRRVVVTHFGPHRQSITPRWRHSGVSAYFSSHLPELVERADLWLHGHTHDGFEYQVGEDPCRGRVICHPRGYAGGPEKPQAMAYSPKLIEVPVNRMPWPEFSPADTELRH